MAMQDIDIMIIVKDVILANMHFMFSPDLFCRCQRCQFGRLGLQLATGNLRLRREHVPRKQGVVHAARRRVD